MDREIRKTRVRQLGSELQVLSSNMLDELDELNLHSSREAAADLHRRLDSITAAMQKMIKDIVHNMEHLGMDDLTDECREMYSMLDISRKCSVEPGSFRNFTNKLIPLIRMLENWSRRGPFDAGFTPNDTETVL